MLQVGALFGRQVMPYNAWVQLGVVYNGHDVKLYVNGVLQNVLTVPLGGKLARRCSCDNVT